MTRYYAYPTVITIPIKCMNSLFYFCLTFWFNISVTGKHSQGILSHSFWGINTKPQIPRNHTDINEALRTGESVKLFYPDRKTIAQMVEYLQSIFIYFIHSFHFFIYIKHPYGVRYLPFCILRT